MWTRFVQSVMCEGWGSGEDYVRGGGVGRIVRGVGKWGEL